MINDSAEFGNAIHRARLTRGLTQQELADKLGVSRLWVIKLEAGNVKANLADVINAFNVLNIELTARVLDAADPKATPKMPGESNGIVWVDPHDRGAHTVNGYTRKIPGA